MKKFYKTFTFYFVIIGMIVGTMFAILKMYMLNSSINKVVEMDKQMAQKSATFSYGIRYMLTAMVLIGTVLYSFETFVGAAIVLVLSTKISIFSIKVTDGDKTKFVDIDKKEETEKIQENKIEEFKEEGCTLFK